MVRDHSELSPSISPQHEDGNILRVQLQINSDMEILGVGLSNENGLLSTSAIGHSEINKGMHE